MTPTPTSAIGQYIMAFIGGFLVPIMPDLFGGTMPTQAHVLVGIGTGLVATGMFHLVPPRAQ